ncbi:MAG: hypothetical protein FWF11_00440, partial [Coriobacteriia bacterium]|nr:hypothetical protein [Coriobacteriia bacterium]
MTGRSTSIDQIANDVAAGNSSAASCAGSVTVSLFGGLGNQMFQYATAAALAHRLQAELLLDLSWFDKNLSATTARPYLLNQFSGLQGRIASNKQLRWAHFLVPGIGNRYAQKAKQTLHRLLPYTQLTLRPHSSRTSIALEPSYDYWNGLQQLSAPLYL